MKDDEIWARLQISLAALLGRPLRPHRLRSLLIPKALRERRRGLPEGFQDRLRDEDGLLHYSLGDLVLIRREQPLTLGNAFQSADLAGLPSVVLQLLLARECSSGHPPL